MIQQRYIEHLAQLGLVHGWIVVDAVEGPCSITVNIADSTLRLQSTNDIICTLPRSLVVEPHIQATIQQCTASADGTTNAKGGASVLYFKALLSARGSHRVSQEVSMDKPMPAESLHAHVQSISALQCRQCQSKLTHPPGDNNQTSLDDKGPVQAVMDSYRANEGTQHGDVSDHLQPRTNEIALKGHTKQSLFDRVLDLPSEQWEEFLDCWVCHPDDHRRHFSKIRPDIQTKSLMSGHSYWMVPLSTMNSDAFQIRVSFRTVYM
jgi:hypothetical protein